MAKHKILLTMVLLLATISTDAKTLVAYYSYTNNVEKIVNELKKHIECDVVEIEPAEKGLDYSANNYALGTQLLNKINGNPDDASSYPAIDRVNIDMRQYDTVIIACPLWWSQMAAPFQTFLFKYGQSMAGKNIGLIVSSASSGISGVEADARRLIPAGKFLHPSLWIRSAQTNNAKPLIEKWLNDINFDSLTSGIDTITTGKPSEATGSVYNLNGLLVATDQKQLNHLPKGIYIVKTGDKTSKIIL